MDEIKLASDLATIKANALHTQETMTKMDAKLDTLLGMKQSVTLYKKMTWFNLISLLGAAGATLWPKG